jgi:hypothetical protein
VTSHNCDIIGEPDKPRHVLALSAMVVYSILSYTYTRVSLPSQSEHTLKLWKDGHISMASQKASPLGSGIIKVVNKESGKMLGRATDFTQANWAATTAEYFASPEANFCDDAKFDKIIDAAKAFVMNNRCGELKSLSIHVDDDNLEAPGECALLINDPDSD